MKTKILIPGALLALFCATAQAQIPIPMVESPTNQPPVPGYYDQYFLPTELAIKTTTSFGDDADSYVAHDRVSKGQTFKTGSSPLGYTLNSITIQHILFSTGNGGTYGSFPNGSLVRFRFGTISGSTLTPIFVTTNATYSGPGLTDAGDSGTGDYFTFNLSGAGIGTLAANTTYFFELAPTVNPEYFEMMNRINSTTNTTYTNGTSFKGDDIALLDADLTVNLTAGEFMFDANLTAVGAPTVVATVNPFSAAVTQPFKITATITPGVGTVTNVNVDLSGIAGPSVATLVRSNTANVYTNTFTIPNASPIGTNILTVMATQNTQPLVGVARVALAVFPGTPPSVVSDVTPASQTTLYVGEGILFSAAFSGLPPITYQWQTSPDGNTFTDIRGATNTTYTISAVALTNAGYYQLQASNQFGTTLAYGANALIYLNVVTGPPFPTYLWSAPISFSTLNADQILTNFPGTKVAGALVAKNGGSPIVVTNSSTDSPIVFAGSGTWASLSGGAGYNNGFNTNLTGNANFNTCLNDGYNDNAIHTITMNGLVVGLQYQVQLFGLDDRNTLSPANTNRYASWQNPADANDIGETFAMADNVYMLGTFTATNTTMAIQQNIYSSGNFNCLVLRAVGWNPPPYLTLQPANVNAFLGTNASLSSSAAGDPTIPNPTVIYQWQAGPTNGPFTNLVEGAKYAGTASTTLTISNLTAADGLPAYLLTAKNSVGSVTSRVALVYVQAAPVPPAPGSYGAFALSLTNNKPVGFWQLNETNDPSTGLLQAYDYSGNGLNGTYGTASLNAYNGIMGPTNYPGFAANQGALQTAANTPASEVTIPPFNLNTNLGSSSTVITTNGVTISMWIKPTANPGINTGLFFHRQNTIEGFGFGGTTSGGMPGLGYDWNNDSATTYNFSSGLYPVLNIWQYVALVVNSNSATFYLYYVTNGVPVLLSAVQNIALNSYTFNGGTTFIGSDANNNANRTFAGGIADVAVYNTALSPGQIAQQFSTGLAVGGFAPQISGLPSDFFFPAPLASGQSVAISAAVNGTYPTTNDWTFNGANLADGPYLGATVSGSQTFSLTVSNFTANNAGAYQLLVTNVFGVATSSVVKVTILPATMVGHWLSVSNSLADTSGYSPAGIHDATVVAGSTYWTNDVPAIAPPGSASLYFNAAGLQIANSATSDAGYTNTFDNQIYNGLTVMCWAKGLPNGIWRTFVAKNGENNGWQIRVSSPTNKPTWTLREANADMQAITLPLSFFTNANAWHHYAGTYNLVTRVRSLYVDGVLIASQTAETAYPSASAYHLTIGQEEQASGIGDGPYTGAMYDVRVYDYALDQSGIASIVGLPEAQTQYATPGAVAKLSTVGINAAPPYSGYRWQINGANLSDGAYLGATISGSSTISLTVSNITVNNLGLYQLLVTNAAGVTTSSIVKLTVLPATKVGQWLTGGAQSLADVSGFSPAGIHDAVVQSGSVIWTNDVPASAAPGSYSLYFNNAGLTISNSSALMDASYTNTFDDEIYKDMTVMCWAKGFPGQWNPWVSKDGDSGNTLPVVGWQLRVNNTGPNAAWTVRGTGGNEDMTSSVGSNDGRWHQYTGTYSASTGVRSLYLDGVLVATQTGQGPYSPTRASHLMIGGKDNGTGISFGNYFTGAIYDVRVYNYALSQSQLAAVVPGLTPSFTSRQFTTGANGGQLVMSWPFGTLLQATNVAGPYSAVAGATSPYTNIINLTVPDLFFRLSNP